MKKFRKTSLYERVLAKSLDVYITVSVMTHYRSYNEIYSSNNNNIYTREGG
jgi:hypothetical protein